jgi:hypothetical protein
MLVAGIMLAPMSAYSQTGCAVGGYRVVARRWDAVLRTGWELRQNCAHPEWPAHSVAVGAITAGGGIGVTEVLRPSAELVPPLLVRAGDAVRLWLQDSTVRIEMSGVAEQSARSGERVLVSVTKQDADEGLTIQRIAGIVRGVGDVEMER